jgi:rRNA maturation RNase YbeY
MSLEVDISFQTPVTLSFKPQNFAKKVAKLKGLSSGQIDITFVDAETILKINMDHLQHNYVTDIITFNLGDTTTPIGDIYICIDQAIENAKAFAYTFENEIRLLIIHGILHLLGFTDYTDEEKAIMDAEQTRILNELSHAN